MVSTLGSRAEPRGARRALLAPDSYKGTLSARDVTDALASGFESRGWEADRCPLADGGEGTTDALVSQFGGGMVEVRAHDPLGREIPAGFCLVDGLDAAAVEVATASGLALLGADERDPERASTSGTGELILAASRRADLVLVGVGGSATNDGGEVAIEAIRAGGGLGPGRLVCLCDVRTPWELASSVFGPQEGADPDQVERLERRLDRLSDTFPRDPRGVPMTGAAGGLSGGLWACFGAELVAGAAYLCTQVELERRIREADVVITGEGRLDETTVEGKVAFEVARTARRVGSEVHAVVGADALDPARRGAIGLSTVTDASTRREIEAAARRLASSLDA